MKQLLTSLIAACTIVTAAGPSPDPVITLEGVAKAAKLSAERKATIAPQVKALNTRLEQMVATKAAEKTAQARPNHGPGHVRPSHDDPMMKELHELMQQLSPEQRAALHEYLHAQLKAAGLEIPLNWQHGNHGSMR